MLKYIKIKYLFLFIICLWEPLQIFILKVDAAQRTIGILILLTVLLNIANTNFIKTVVKAPIIYWGLWVIYAFINTITIKYNLNLPYYSFLIVLLAPLMVLWVITADNFEDRKILFNVILYGLYIRTILIFIFESNRSGGHRLGSYIDSNAIAFSSVILIIFLYLKYLYKEIELKVLLISITLPLYLIFATASRNAFGAFVILLASHFYINRSKKLIHNLAILLLGTVFVLGTFYFVIENTYMGKRLTETTQQNTEAYYYQIHGTIFEKFGDRGIFYVLGFQLFKEHPVRGIGLYNFSTFQGTYVLHSEIMIQLCELGLIGSMLFALFYGWIGKNLLYCWKCDIDNRKITEAYISCLIIILFMGLSIFQYNNPMFFLLSGTIIAHIMDIKEKIKLKVK